MNKILPSLLASSQFQASSSLAWNPILSVIVWKQMVCIVHVGNLACFISEDAFYASLNGSLFFHSEEQQGVAEHFVTPFQAACCC